MFSAMSKTLVADAFATNWIAPLGPHVDAFEEEFQRRCRSAACSRALSGTAALHLAMELLGVGAGDEVICSSLTFMRVGEPHLLQRATPVFVDCDGTLDDRPKPAGRRIEAQRCRRTKSEGGDRRRPVRPVCRLRSNSRTCRALRRAVVEDAAEALGATYRGRPAGGFGRLGVFSFNGNKIITTSGGGMLVSHEKELVDRARFLASQARDPAPHYEHSHIGYNYRLSNILAAIGRGQLRTLAERVAIRRRTFERYAERPSGPPRPEAHARSAVRSLEPVVDMPHN